MRDIKRIKRILKLLEKVWVTQPDWRLGQLLVNIYGSEILWFVEDDLWEEALKEWIKLYKHIQRIV